MPNFCMRRILCVLVVLALRTSISAMASMPLRRQAVGKTKPAVQLELKLLPVEPP